MNRKLIDVKTLSEKICISPIQGSLKYATKENFVGRIVNGYSPNATDVFLLEKNAGYALCKANDFFIKNYNLSILFHDGFRPLRAVKDFAKWIKNTPESDYELERKNIHYPFLTKQDISDQGFLATEISRHCYGFAVDITLQDLNGKELDFGCIFDYFGEKSFADAPSYLIGEKAYENRKILYEGMKKAGFEVFSKEYWHFDFEKIISEPMDFDITTEFKAYGI